MSLVVSGDSWGNAAVRTKEGVEETPWRRQAPRHPRCVLSEAGALQTCPSGKATLGRSQEESGDTYGQAVRRASDSQSQWLPRVMQKHLG